MTHVNLGPARQALTVTLSSESSLHYHRFFGKILDSCNDQRVWDVNLGLAGGNTALSPVSCLHDGRQELPRSLFCSFTNTDFFGKYFPQNKLQVQRVFLNSKFVVDFSVADQI